MSASQIKVLLSSGGTGGHMSPASALAQDLILKGIQVELATDSRGLKYQAMFKNIPVHTIASGTAGAGLKGKVKGVVQLLKGFVQAYQLLKKLKPDCVVGFGGYPSVPAVWMAQRLGIPTILHEQNAIVGKANVFLAPKAKKIALSLASFDGLTDSQKTKSVVTGNPVRPEICQLNHLVYTPPQEKSEMRLFIMGGSLGAKVFSDVVPQALQNLPQDYRSRLKIVQQCRQDDIDRVKGLYQKAGIEAQLSSFIDNVADYYAACHLFIGRSGASTVAEVTTAGRPAIFVPYPHHKDQQQKRNADSVADHGGAWVMTEAGFTPEVLSARIESFFQNPDILSRAAENAKLVGKPEAAGHLSNLVLEVIQEKAKSQ